MHFLPLDNSPDGILRIALSQRVHTDVLRKIAVDEGEMLSVFCMKAVLSKQGEKGIKVMGLLLQRFINGDTQHLPMGGFSLEPMPAMVCRVATLGIFNNRKLVLDADKVAQSGNGSARPSEVPELSLTVQRG